MKALPAILIASMLTACLGSENADHARYLSERGPPVLICPNGDRIYYWNTGDRWPYWRDESARRGGHNGTALKKPGCVK